MIAGQSVDLQMTDRVIDFPTLEFIHSRKTGRALHGLGRDRRRGRARRSPRELAAVVAYAKNLGLAFQIVDDLIDATGGSRGRQGRRPGRQEDDLRLVLGRRGRARAGAASSSRRARRRSSRSAPARSRCAELARYVVARRR